MFSFKTLLTLGDFNVDSILESLSGNTYELSDFSFGFDRGTDNKGKPSTRIVGGRFSFVIPYLPSKSLVKWSADAREYLDGTFSLFDNEGITLDRIIFKNATCTNMNISYNNNGKGFFNTSLIVYAEEVFFMNGVPFSNEWIDY